MPAKIIHAHRRPDGYHFRVHLDTEMRDEEGEPHSDWVREYSFGNLTPGVHQQHGLDMTEAEYYDAMEAMVREQVALELAKMRPPKHPVVDRFHGKEL
jgi:hypothetical protein